MKLFRRRSGGGATSAPDVPEPERPGKSPSVDRPDVPTEPEVRESLKQHFSARARVYELFVREYGWAAAILLALAILVNLEVYPSTVWIPIVGFIFFVPLLYAVASRWAQIPMATLLFYQIQPDGSRDFRITQVARALWTFIAKKGQSNMAVSPSLGEFYHIEAAKWLGDCPTEITYAYSGGSDIDLVTRKEVLDHVKEREAVATKLVAKLRLLDRLTARDLATEAAEEVAEVLAPLPQSTAAMEKRQQLEDEVDEMLRQLSALRRTSREQPVEQPADIATDEVAG